MSGKEAKPAAATGGNKPAKKSGKMGTIMFMFMLAVATPFILPTVTLVLAGLIPTYIAFATDDDPQKSGAVSVGAMNLAGITPFIIDLWSKGQTIGNAMHILTDPNSWVVILGAAGIGQLIVYAIPQAIATLTLTHAEARVKNMRKNLDLLKASWGPEVATTKPIDRIIQE